MEDTLVWPAARVRETFLNFFEERQHTIMPSSSVLPHESDDSLLYVNSGMVPYKPVFLGTVTSSDRLYGLKRVANLQNCIRAGGKHNDLDDVGKDSYHHTCFQMAGNWSFGDYFKKEAIEFAWTLLTEVYKLEPSRLYATYFEGDEALGLEPDLEAKALWMAVGVAEDHILPGNMKDNFWEMGDQGPCGPCSELHYDIRGGRNAADLVNKDDPEVIEIWNLVFMAYNREADRSLRPLPSKHIDTGLGFERLVSCLQGKTSNYSTDIWSPIFDRIQVVTGARPYTDRYGPDDADMIDTAYRVVADHLRLLSIAIADGVVPNNMGRGYVLRRVLRRGVRYARRYFKADIGSFFSQIAPILNDQFPHLEAKQGLIKEILDEEEVAFAKTLDRGEVQFEKYATATLARGDKKLAGADVWRLYDTFGFPEDLTEIMAGERGLVIDKAEVSVAREKAREASKSAKTAVETFTKLNVHQLAELEGLGIARTKDDEKFVNSNSKGKIQLIWTGKEFIKSTKSLASSEATEVPLGIVLDTTNFYAEQGGQVADTGKLIIDDVAEFKVLDVQTHGGYIVHNGYLVYGALSAGDEVICEYDELRRLPIRRNHTGTHVLNHSLREVLGDGVHQKGSLVDDQKLRFDLSHMSAITVPELRRVEDLSNAYVKRDSKVYAKEIALDSAKEIQGLRAVFGETYPNPVRVVSLGVDVDTLLKDPKNPEWEKVSVELCGGTHVDTTAAIKDMVVVEEGGIGKGIRRIVALTGDAAYQARHDQEVLAEKIDAVGKLTYGTEKEKQVKDVGTALSRATISLVGKAGLKEKFDVIAKSVLEEQKKLKKLQKTESKTALDLIDKHFTENPDDRVWIGQVSISAANGKAIADVLRQCQSKAKERSVCVLAGGKEEGVMYGVYVGTEASARGLTAEAWTGAIGQVLEGRSGGKEPMMQGQGSKGEKLSEAIEEARRLFAEKLSL